MADPLSVAASAIAVLSTCINCADTLYSLIKGIHNAPNDLLNLSNEVNHLKAVLDEATRFEEHNAAPTHLAETLEGLLTEAKETLGELDDLVLRYKSGKLSLKRCVTWLCQKDRAKALQKRLKHTRSTIVALLTTNSA